MINDKPKIVIPMRIEVSSLLIYVNKIVYLHSLPLRNLIKYFAVRSINDHPPLDATKPFQLMMILKCVLELTMVLGLKHWFGFWPCYWVSQNNFQKKPALPPHDRFKAKKTPRS